MAEPDYELATEIARDTVLPLEAQNTQRQAEIDRLWNVRAKSWWNLGIVAALNDAWVGFGFKGTASAHRIAARRVVQADAAQNATLDNALDIVGIAGSIAPESDGPRTTHEAVSSMKKRLAAERPTGMFTKRLRGEVAPELL